jgi:hypothetical protein
MVSKDFITAGKATFTLELPHEWASAHRCKPHYTYKVRKKVGNDGRPVFFVSILSGPNNESDYRYIGILTFDGQVRTTAKSALHAESMPVRLLNRSLRLVWQGDATAMEEAGFQLHHEGKCGHCGRKLSTPESLRTGFGPKCRGDF